MKVYRRMIGALVSSINMARDIVWIHWHHKGSRCYGFWFLFVFGFHCTTVDSFSSYPCIFRWILYFFSLLLHICMFAFVRAPYFSSCLSVCYKKLGFELLLGPGFLHFILFLLQQLNWEINYETSLIHFLCALANISCPNPLSIQWHCGLKSKKIFILLLSENVTLSLC